MMRCNTNSIYKVRAGQHSIEQMDKLGQGNQLKNQLAKLHADQYDMYKPLFFFLSITIHYINEKNIFGISCILQVLFTRNIHEWIKKTTTKS